MGENEKRSIHLQIAKLSAGNYVYLNDIDDNKSDTVRIPWSDFSEAFYSSKTFPLNGYSIPKIVQYYSPLFAIEDKSHSFFFKSMNPKLVSYVNELGDTIEGYVPWTHCFVLVNHDDQTIVDFSMFFSETQIKSEFLHDFFVPNIESEYLKTSSFLESFIGISDPVYSLPSAFEDNFAFEDFYRGSVLPYRGSLSPFSLDINKTFLGLQVQDSWDIMVQNYLRNCKLETVLSTEISESEDNFTTHCLDIEKAISIEKFESFCAEQSLTTKSFYEILSELYDQHKIVEYQLPNMGVTT